jgi:ABC-2 type transport system ATP-binding protein
MQHAERLTNRIVLLARGRKVFEGTQEEARARLPGRLTLVSEADPSSLTGIASATRARAANGWNSWDVSLKPGVAPGDLLQVCTQNGFALRGFESHRPSLHDVFIHLVGPEQETQP